MSRQWILWLAVVALFAAYYAAFGKLSVEGHATPPLLMRILDVVMSVLMFLMFGGIATLVGALFLFRGRTYGRRVVMVFPYALALVIVVVMFSEYVLTSQGIGPLP